MSGAMVLAVMAIAVQLAGVAVRATSRAHYIALIIAGDVLMGVAGLLWHDWLFAAIFFALAALTAWQWWRKRRDPAARTLGAKARAARDALVRKAREAAQPRPVLRPVPQGARSAVSGHVERVTRTGRY